MNNEPMQAAMKELQDAMVVMAHMEARQTERLLRQETEIEQLAEARMLGDVSMKNPHSSAAAPNRTWRRSPTN
jgi:hypothetical protein